MNCGRKQAFHPHQALLEGSLGPVAVGDVMHDGVEKTPASGGDLGAVDRDIADRSVGPPMAGLETDLSSIHDIVECLPGLQGRKGADLPDIHSL
jgi:hypothetical protein